MSTVNTASRARINGRFVKKAKLNKHVKLQEGRAKAQAARRHRLISESLVSAGQEEERTAQVQAVTEEDSELAAFLENVMQGRRVVDIAVLWKEMFCKVCKRGLCFRDIKRELSKGLAYVWRIRCPYCLLVKDLATSDTYLCKDTGRSRYVVNAKALLGILDCDMGPTQLNTVLTALNIPHVNAAVLGRTQNDVGPAVFAVAQDSCTDALMLEKELTEKSPLRLMNTQAQYIDGMDLSDQDENPDEPLPLETIQGSPEGTSQSPGVSSTTPSASMPPPSTAATARTPTQSSQLSPRNAFTTTPRRRTKVAFSCDMSFSTRFSGFRYDSQSAQSTICGVKSGKVCGFKVINRRCIKCILKKPHKLCGGMFKGSAKAMEPEAAVQLMVKNPMLDKAGVVVAAFAGDDDASSVAALKRASDHHIEKWSDHNHAKKNLRNALYKIHSRHTKAFPKTAIKYLMNNYGHAVAQNRNNVLATGKAIINVVKHAFGQHGQCGDWCGYRKDPANYKHAHLPNGADLKGELLKSDLLTAFGRFARKSAAIAPGASSQKNESVNNVFLSKSSKRVFTGGSMRHTFKVSAGVAQVNRGTQYTKDVFEKLNFSPSSRGLRYRVKKDIWRSQVARIKAKRASKIRRKLLVKMRNQIQDRHESQEGLVYESGMGFNQPNIETAPCGGEVKLVETRVIPQVKDVKFVFFDVETNGYGQIVQLAAKEEGAGGAKFSEYAYPQNGMKAEVSEITRLTLENGELCFNGKPVPAASMHKLLQNFLVFLRSMGGPIVLVAHNAHFDLNHLIAAAADYFLLEMFADLVVGVTDTLPTFRSNAVIVRDHDALQEIENQTPAAVGEKKKRKSPIPAGQTYLAAKYLPNYKSDDAHEALYDCVILEDLCTALDVCRQTLYGVVKPFSFYVERKVLLLNRKKYVPGLVHMIEPNVISQATVEKLAERAFTMKKLVDLYLKSESDFRQFIKENIIKKSNSVEGIVKCVAKAIRAAEGVQ